MKQYQYKIARSIFFVVVALAFFVFGLVVAIQPEIPKEMDVSVTLNQAALTGCIMMLLSLVLLGFALFDIAINNNAINEQREAQAKERSSVVKEEEQLALLERYKKIHVDGLISDEEFELRKKAIMRDLSRK